MNRCPVPQLYDLAAETISVRLRIARGHARADVQASTWPWRARERRYGIAATFMAKDVAGAGVLGARRDALRRGDSPCSARVE